MPTPLVDEEWLRERVAWHLNTTEIAEEAGVTPRAVRYALRRHGIERPPRQDLIDVALAEYRAGTPLQVIAAQVHRTTSWIHKVVREAGAERPPGYSRHPAGSRKYPQLNDAEWMAAQFEAGGSLRSIAQLLGCDRQMVRKAMVRHGLDRWPSQLVQRFQFAVELEAEAHRRQARVVNELLARGRSVAEVARLLGTTPGMVRRLSGSG